MQSYRVQGSDRLVEILAARAKRARRGSQAGGDLVLLERPRVAIMPPIGDEGSRADRAVRGLRGDPA